MPRRLLPLAFVLVLAAAACAEPPEAEIGFGSGVSFVPQVADAQDDVGLYPSVAVDADGVPYVAYFGFPEELAEGEVAVPRSIGSPSVPSVLLASVNEGIWTRGAVAMEKAIPNVSVAYGPAEVPSAKSMTPENVNGSTVAFDADGGIHVAWVANTGVWYASNPDGTSFTASQVEKAKIEQRGPIGRPAIAVDGQGSPWIAYTKTTSQGQDVIVATQSGSTWSTDVVDTIPLQAGGTQPGPTAIATGSDGRPVVLYCSGSAVRAVVSDPENGWVSFEVESGADAAGPSLAAAADGTLHAAYYAGGEVHAAASDDGTTWNTSTVATVGSGDNEAGRSTGVGVDDGGTAFVTWYDPGTDDIRLASGEGSDLSPIEIDGTTGGDLPSLAVAPNGEAYVAWYDQTEQNLMLGAYGDVEGMELAVKSPTPTAAAQPSASPTGATEQCTTAENGELTVSAQGLAFDTNCIEIPAGEKVTIHFDNKDSGTQHNVAVYPSENELTNPMFRGDLVTGPDTIDYEVGPFDAGEYYFHCDVHPTMNGIFKVVSGGGGGGGGGGNVAVTTSVTASGIAFDTNEIDLAAGKETTLTFDNQDAGTPHNIAIYPDAASVTTARPLFQGEVVTGPTKTTYTIPPLDPGTYYFQCDVHPTMNGSVVVR